MKRRIRISTDEDTMYEVWIVLDAHINTEFDPPENLVKFTERLGKRLNPSFYDGKGKESDEKRII